MNTRLQVEHPVTELVTGLDLVAWQIRIASGEPLDFTQDDVAPQRARHRGPHQRRGPERRPLLALAGHPHRRSTQPSGPGVRLDAGYESGDTVSQYYDNLIAKLIVWAPDREAARRRMLRAIGETRITGVATTLPGRRGDPEPPRLRRGARTRPSGSRRRLDLSGLVAEPAGAPAPAPAEDEVPTVQRDVTAEVDGRRFSVRLWVPDLGTGRRRRARGADGPKRAAASAVAGTGSGQVTVPMQGTIVKVLVAVGDVVEVGQSSACSRP